jgi:hypothetical protein
MKFLQSALLTFGFAFGTFKILVSSEQIQNFEVLNLAMAKVKKSISKLRST